ncbi:helix-turn-helix domain-containing protein [Streptacidiphilus sp. 4-A2]|nr:helix-turn-helix domain-containing protein [Streptacidiphilus sp. 4-A2]
MPQGGRTTVRSRRLGRELKDARVKSGQSQEDAATALLCNASKISRIESGHVSARPLEVVTLLRLYGVVDDPARVKRLEELARVSSKRGWWLDYEAIPNGYADQISLEDDATHISEWGSALIPGLCQSPKYAQKTIENGPNFVPPDQIKELVEVRKRRQRLISTEGIYYAATLWECAVTTPAWGLEVHEDQLKHLLSLTEQSNITIQILPMREIAAATLTGPFSAYAFSEEPAFEAVRVSNAMNTTVLESGSDLTAYSRIYDRLRSAALSQDQSAKLIRNILGNLNKGQT